MKRIAMAATTALLVMVGVAGCGGTGDSNGSGSAAKPAASKPAKLEPANITLWSASPSASSACSRTP